MVSFLSKTYRGPSLLVRTEEKEMNNKRVLQEV